MLSLSEREKERCEASVTQCRSIWLTGCVGYNGTNCMPYQLYIYIYMLWLARECISAFKGDNLHTGSHSS